MARTLDGAAWLGTNTVAGMESLWAARAIPSPWLPLLAVTTPCRFCSSLRQSNAWVPPRTLNEPVDCRFSHLNHT